MLSHLRRVSVLPQTEVFCCWRNVNVDSTCQGLCLHAFPHSDNKPSKPRISQTPLSQQLFFFPKQTPHTHSRLFLSRSYGISREPPRPGCEGRLERQKAAQGCGELHVEHHHSEGEIFSHITYKSSQFY